MEELVIAPPPVRQRKRPHNLVDSSEDDDASQHGKELTMRQAPTPLETDSALQPAEADLLTETHPPAEANPPAKANPPARPTPPTDLLESDKTVTATKVATDPAKQYEFPAMDTDPVDNLDIPRVPVRESINKNFAPHRDTTAINDKPPPLAEDTPMELARRHTRMH
ncbi:unnamed protein product [Arabis nemorensis]|uniref:Uncharacterized protein n=1 Tax=Arabis nemorensis TaxID=586526 RepID=A0A565CCP7_9BRAS|nr:unnamed protein product [Arabis nemorensis]